MQGNARGTYECGCKVPEERRGIQGNTGECQVNVWKWVQSARGTHGSGCKVLAE